jgi:hypothetical protein
MKWKKHREVEPVYSMMNSNFDEIEAYLPDGRRITNELRDIYLARVMSDFKDGILQREVTVSDDYPFPLRERINRFFKRAS